MKLYLSSYKFGNETETLKMFISQTSGRFAYVPNAQDFIGADQKRREDTTRTDMEALQAFGTQVELLDLKQYFGKSEELANKLKNLDGLYVRGGNTFVLRQAMKLSGLDAQLLHLQTRDNFVYVAYSAGVCVLTPTLKPYAITDDAENFPYAEYGITEQIWDGLGIVPFVFQPHYKSDHPESASTDKEVEYCIENKVLFKAYHDGEVLIITS